MLLPHLSELDPDTKGEGSIDPLGLYTIADALGVRMIPGVRERQSRARFLTAMAVSLWVCETFEPEQLAADEVSEAWQVFEWYTVEGLVRAFRNESDEYAGTPGTLKAIAALKDKVPLCADRYLKTPNVFGYHGVYRILARDLRIDTGARLGDFGYDLVSVWAEEQGLRGFVSGGGTGSKVLKSLRDAVADGLKRGSVARTGGWTEWAFFPDHLAPGRMGDAEAERLKVGLLNSVNGFRREVIEFLVSRAGRKAWESGRAEREFHAALRASASVQLAELLDAIDCYERFARMVYDAFVDCLVELTLARRRLSAAELAQCVSVAKAAKELPALFVETRHRLEVIDDLLVRFDNAFSSLGERAHAEDWVRTLIDHHTSNQRRKPPAGKAPWVEQLDDGRYLVRALYRTEKGGAHDSSYLHAYRTRPLWSYVHDMGLVA